MLGESQQSAIYVAAKDEGSPDLHSTISIFDPAELAIKRILSHLKNFLGTEADSTNQFHLKEKIPVVLAETVS